MPTLKVRDFSCIQHAHIVLSDFTVLIGPQGSGKSVLSKLLYFMSQYISRPLSISHDTNGIEAYREEIEKEFRRFFPDSAWGPLGFAIEFETGLFSIKVARNKPRRENSSGRLRVSFSSEYTNFYKALSDAIQHAYSQRDRINVENLEVAEMYDITSKIRMTFRSRFFQSLRAEDPGFILFIPAGRAFFTSMGKAAMAFEHAGVLDPLTTRFGRLFSNLHDRRVSIRATREDKELRSARDRIALDLFGGVIKMQRDQEFILYKDGRKIPFAIMSSGQQELLPLWEAIDYYLYQRGLRSTIFIEEPEAHLFPAAQTDITEYLSAFVSNERQNRLIVTTHSPYVLSKINNLLKAGSVGEMKGKSQQVEKIIPKFSWLKPGSVAAYCIKSGVVSSIFCDGLVEADYLDSISGGVAEEFSKLLDIEFLQ